MTRSLRVMTYSHDGFGLGHLRRNTVIASEIARIVPGSNVLMTVGCPSGALFHLPSGVDSIKIPSVMKKSTGSWDPRTLNVGTDAVQALRSTMILESAKLFEPHVFLADHLPAGVYGELLPTLEFIKNQAEPGKLVLGIRDILDAPEVTRSQWSSDNSCDIVRKYYDDVLVYGSREIFDTAEIYGFNTEFGERLSYCGYVRPDMARRSIEQLRKELHIREKQFIVITAGAGADAFPMMSAAVDTLRELCSRQSVEAVMITGILMGDTEKQRLRESTADLPVHVFCSVDDHPAYVQAADLVICMGGYNTMVEAVHLQQNTLVVPRSGPSAEQAMRAKLFSELGLVKTVSLEELSAGLLQILLAERNPKPNYRLDTGGLQRAVSVLLDQQPTRLEDLSNA